MTAGKTRARSGSWARKKTENATVEAEARARVRSDEAAITGTRRSVTTLGATFRAFWRHPSPWMISAVLLTLVPARLAVGDWRTDDAYTPLLWLAFFPVVEWLIHVFVLHWRPKTIGNLTLDTKLAGSHRAHHADPRNVPLVFIPWRSLAYVIIVYNGLSLLAFPRLGQALSFMLSVAAVGLLYEWTHYLIHSDYRPKSRMYKAIWRNHRLHHYKNEHYWFTVTTTATADILLRTYPDPETVQTSPTAKNLHGI
ncbi:sterol desaturase family protein [Streptomyces sp. NPDC048419]|uniref:sterol desaturase family protein n=1 Tax=Streptomyces sp. NPDC048419 TaxID=3365547 RepID=UPI00372475E7